ncbi:Cys-tRNA(Pro) deacylase, partial [Dysosmobacter welbionis]
SSACVNLINVKCRAPVRSAGRRSVISMKFAIVDLGSNTIRLSVYNTLPEGGFDLLFSEKEMAGLVSYVHGGVLSPEGIQRACGAIRDFQALLRQFDLDAPHVFATASLRNIRNTEEAVEQIRAATGVGVDVISGELEARLGYYGARTATDLQDGAMFDIGGGSAEVLEV